MINQYRILSSLGEGSFGKVKLAMDVKTKEMYAIKIMSKKKLKRETVTTGKSAYDMVLQELEILQSLDHPNCLWLHEIINSPVNDHLYLVTEFHANGSIVDLIEKRNP